MTENNEGTKCKVGSLKVGDRLSRIQYYEVVKVDVEKDTFHLKNQQGFSFRADKKIIEAEMFSAQQFLTEEKVNRTRLIELLEGARDTCFTVTFLKQLTQKQLAERLEDIDMSAHDTSRKRSKLAKTLLQGEERVLVGYLQSTESQMGRSMVIDLEIASGYNIRLVDHRTINSLIYKNVRYFC